MNDELMKEIILRYKDQVTPPFDDILETIGIDALYYIANEFGGSDLYIPTARRMFGPCLSRQITSDFTGDNYRELAKRYGLCARAMRSIVDRERKKNKPSR